MCAARWWALQPGQDDSAVGPSPSRLVRRAVSSFVTDTVLPIRSSLHAIQRHSVSPVRSRVALYPIPGISLRVGPDRPSCVRMMSGSLLSAHRTGRRVLQVCPVFSESVRAGGKDVMSGHQEFKALSAEEVERAAMRVAEMEKWAREAYLATKHVEDIEDIWVRYFEAEHHLHFIIPPATEPDYPQLAIPHP